MPVFGLPKRNGKVVVTVVPNYLKEELMPFFKRKSGRLDPPQDGRNACDDLILNDYSTDCRVFRHENEFARGESHVNGIECF